MKAPFNLLLVPLGIFAIAALTGARQDKTCCDSGMLMAQASHDGAEGSPAKQLKGKQTATVRIDNGYSPAVILVKQGKPVELTFTGGKNIGCGGTVVFESLKISKDVAVGKSVVIKFTPKRKGEIPFTCGMGMLDGKVIVQ